MAVHLPAVGGDALSILADAAERAPSTPAERAAAAAGAQQLAGADARANAANGRPEAPAAAGGAGGQSGGGGQGHVTEEGGAAGVSGAEGAGGDTAEVLAALDAEWALVPPVSASQEEALAAGRPRGGGGDTYEESPLQGWDLQLPQTQQTQQQQPKEGDGFRTAAQSLENSEGSPPLPTQPTPPRQPARLQAVLDGESDDSDLDGAPASAPRRQLRSLSRSPPQRGPGGALPGEQEEQTATPAAQPQAECTPPSTTRVSRDPRVDPEEVEREGVMATQAAMPEAEEEAAVFMTQMPCTQAPLSAAAETAEAQADRPRGTPGQTPTEAAHQHEAQPQSQLHLAQAPSGADEHSQLATQGLLGGAKIPDWVNFVPGSPPSQQEAATQQVEAEEPPLGRQQGFDEGPATNQLPPPTVTLPDSVPETQQIDFGDGGGVDAAGEDAARYALPAAAGTRRDDESPRVYRRRDFAGTPAKRVRDAPAEGVNGEGPSQPPAKKPAAGAERDTDPRHLVYKRYMRMAWIRMGLLHPSSK